MSTKNQDKHETIADIVAEKRKCIEEMSRNLSIVPIRREEQLAEIERIEVEASRLEAALKREATTTEKSSTVGNSAAMREALKEIRARLVYLYGHIDGTFDPPALKEVCGIADEALAKPPRNCDVGKANEQAERFKLFCNRRECITCELNRSSPFRYGCFSVWSQMPYEEGEAK